MTTPTCGDFQISHYRELLQTALDLGYVFATFAEHEPVDADKLFLLRHDIDLSVDKAFAFANIEAEMGIRATYFVRVHARFYNPFELETYKKLRGIENLGHEMGIHYEPGFADAVDEDAVAMVKREKAIFEALLGHPVVSAASHLPGQSGRIVTEDNLSRFGLRYEAYTPHFLQGFKYLSDSGGRWREGCLCGHLGQHDHLYCLIHPFWWYDKSLVENF